MTVQYFKTGAEVKVNLVAETTPGVTPATPTMIQIPVTKFDLELTQNTYEDTSIFADRMEHNSIAGLRKVTGSLAANLSHVNYAPILQTAMFNTFVSKVLKTGTNWNTLTFEEYDAVTATGFVSTGCFADKLAIKVPVNGVVTVDATINGMSQTNETAPLSASPTAPVVEVPFTHLGGTIMEGGSAIAYLTAIDLTIDNGATELSVLGAQTPVGYTPGLSKVTGTLTAWVPNLTLFNKYFNQTQTSVNFTLTDGTNTLEFNMPNVVYTSAKHPVAGEKAVALTIAFKAIKDATTGSNLIITES
jgi:hypothetical protein